MSNHSHTIDYGKWEKAVLNHLGEDDSESYSMGDGLDMTFMYPAGVKDPVEVAFDIRHGPCCKYGGSGAKHGDIVLSEAGTVATIIGVRPDPNTREPIIWLHGEGSKGAGHFGSQALRLISRVPAVTEHGEPDGKAPTEIFPWLRPSFGYVRNVKGTPTWAKFDIRDDICEKVGRFHHGQLVEGPNGFRAVVIGVLQDAAGLVALYLEEQGADAAAALQFADLEKLNVVGKSKMKVAEIPESESRCSSNLIPPLPPTLPSLEKERSGWFPTPMMFAWILVLIVALLSQLSRL